ncbi:YlxR family protein [Gordonia sp. X0973]|uniref:YlxR family protein n=1 Tax=Gordonia sp. X0973 TaxID=2742602 RepID=UPI000F532251|nr:YlxR family protein [Gordonia sp. X0973]QKT09101.1 YlxR family protein [Gordonia sp. X0973]
MCLGCRGRADRAQLVRVVAASGPIGPVVEIDYRKTLPGRGAWLHPSTDCLSEAVRRKAFASALRVDGITVDPDGLVASLVAAGGGDQPEEQVAQDMSTP